jgi:hypothetical protein
MVVKMLDKTVAGSPTWVTTRRRAYLQDRGSLWVDFDEVSGSYGIFGTETGFCYSTYTDEQEATRAMSLLTQPYNTQ